MYNNQLFISIVIYLVLSMVVIYTKPHFIFGEDGEINNRNIWLYFLLSAILIYTIVCVYISNIKNLKFCKDIKLLKNIC